MALFFAGCDCSPVTEASITIVSPTEGATLSLGDDTDAVTDGLQIEVMATSIGLGRGDFVDILVDGVAAGTGTVDGEGDIVAPGVTLTSGTHRLTAVSREGAVTSPDVAVTVDDSCATITFVMPEPPSGGRLNLGPADDTDGEMCGTTFETTVSVATDAGDGAEVRVFVNGTPRSSTTVAGTVATIDNVALDNRGDSPNTLSVTVTRADGVACSADFPAQIYVDCAGASCEITRPDSTTAFLNQSHDVSTDAGFQGEFDVTTDAEGAGQNIRLIIDGNESGALVELPTMVGMGGVATYGSVELSEGLHRFVAECDDGAGNLTRSGAVEWTVDITPCGIAITNPDGTRTITDDMDDTDPAAAGIQLAVDGTTTGADCTGIRVGNCATVATQMFAMTDTPWSVIADLPTDAMQELCAQVEDVAGNVGEFRLPLTVRTDAPQLQIDTPATGVCFNEAGGGPMSCIADLASSTPTCEAAFSIYCTDVGVDVTLHSMGMAPTLPGGTAPCVADGAAPSPFTGRADFAMVSLPTRTGLTPVAVEARQEVAGLTGTTSRTFISDCEAPGLSFGRPSCGATLRPSTDDEDLVAAGFQYGVDVFNLNSPKPPVDLTITDSSGGVVDMATSMTPATGPSTVFRYGDFTAGGTLTLSACASDMIGNRGCNSDAPCTVTVADIPTLSITVPAGSSVLGAADDCDPGTAGMQIRVTANTDAAVGSPATIQIGALAAVATTVMSGGSPNRVTACTDAPDGMALPIVVTVTDASRGMAMASISVTIDSMPPTSGITDFAPSLPAVDARGGQVNYTWTAVADTGGANLDRYEVRCSTAGPITNETEWTAASMVSITVMPAASGTGQMETIGGFRIGTERWCVIRGFDAANAPTPLPSTAPASVTLAPTEVTITTPTNGEGISVVGIGDVNGDTFGDVLLGSIPGVNTAYVHFGSATGPSATPDITITGGSSFGISAAAVGDIDGDGVSDFAISRRAHRLGGTGGPDLSGSVYVFFGRTTSDPAWPSTIDVAGMTCMADLCFTSGETPALLGWGLAALGDFDGDGIDDMAIGAPQAQSNAGRVFIIKGQTSWTAGSAFTLPGAGAPNGFMLEAPSTTGQLGYSVATCGDLSSDSRSELIVGAIGTATLGSLVGRVNGRAYPAATTGLVTIPSTQVLTIDTAGTTTPLGSTTVCLGDHNGDGLRDLATFNSAGSAGQVRVYTQSGGTFSAASSFVVTNLVAGSSNDFYGGSLGLGYHPMLGRIGDFDRDTRGELLCGSNETGTAPGDVTLFYGGAGVGASTRTAADVTWAPATADASSFRTAAFIGDVTGDGYPDFAIGDRNNMSNAGRVLIYY